MVVLEGGTAIITGAARGIGEATARLLADHGAKILLCDIDEDKCEEVAADIGPTTAACQLDVTSE